MTWQVRLLAVAVAPLGWVAGTIGARAALDALHRHGLALPVEVLPTPVLPALIATAVTFLVAAVAGTVAARRISRPAPAVALHTAQTQPISASRLRTALGIVVAGAGLATAGRMVTIGGTDAANASLLILAVLLIAVSLLGPVLARVLVRALAWPVRVLWPAVGWLSDVSLRGHARRVSAAAVPIALLVAIAVMFLTVGNIAAAATFGASAAHVGGLASSSDRWLRQMELTLLGAYTSIAVVNTLAAITLTRRREFGLLALVGASRGHRQGMLLLESIVICVVGVLLGTAVATVALGVFSAGVTGTAAFVLHPAAIAVVASFALLLVLPTVAGSGSCVMRGSPVEAVTDAR